MDTNELVTLAGVFLGGVIASYIGYFRARTPRPSDPVIAGVGLELGNRHQVDQLIAETRRMADHLERIADALTDRRTESINDRLEKLTTTVEALLERRPRRGS